MHQKSSEWTRREFLRTSAAVAAAGALAGSAQAQDDIRIFNLRPPKGACKPPVVIASGNGLASVAKAMEMIRSGADPLDAVIAGVNLVENDPEDHSVGLGGLPNEDGVVELDSCCMHGPTHKAGGVAALQNIKNPSLVAQKVMQRTDHVLLVGEGALRFARAHGFKEENLLTDETREIWLRWKESHSTKDDWLSPDEMNPNAKGDKAAPANAIEFTYGTINCCAVDAAANLAGVTTTSGLSYKIPGRVGDSPIIGAGLYVDNDVGAAGSTGRGEANLQNCSSFMIVEYMRSGMHPTDACLAMLRRVAEKTEPRLRDKQGRPKFDLWFYAVAKDGCYGCASMWSGRNFAVCDEAGARLEKCDFLYARD